MGRLVAVLLLCACGSLFTHTPDAGSGGGSGEAGGGAATGGGTLTGGGSALGGGTAAGGGSMAGGGSAAGGGAAMGGGSGGGSADLGGGMSTGGGAGDAGALDSGTGGGVYDGDGGAFTWARILDPTPGTANETRLFTAVTSFGPNDVWFAATVTNGYDNMVFHYDGSPTLQPAMASTGVEVFSDLEIMRNPNRLAVVKFTQLFDCDHDDGGCTLGQQWHVHTVGGTGDTANGLCTDGRRFIVAGTHAPSIGALFADSAPLATFPQTATLNDCVVLADGTIVAAATGQLAYVFSDGGSQLVPVTPDNLSFADSVVYNAIFLVQGRLFIAGDNQIIVEALGDGGFTLDREVGTAGAFYALGGLYDRELFAVGESSTVVDPAAMYDGVSWSGTTLLPLINLRAIHAVSVNEYFAVGQDVYSSGAVIVGQILHGTR
jgi:hypothetical protein